MTNNESGFAHMQLVALAVVVVAVISFAAFRIGVISQTNEQAKNESSDTELVDDIIIKETEESKEIEIPTEKTEAVKQPVPVSEPVAEKKTAEPIKKKEDKTWLQMQLISATQNNSVYNVVSRLPSPQSGTCNFKLWNNEVQGKVYTSNKISNSTDCAGQLSLANLSTYSGWELHVWFDSDDGKIKASQNHTAVLLTNPN